MLTMSGSQDSPHGLHDKPGVRVKAVSHGAPEPLARRGQPGIIFSPGHQSIPGLKGPPCENTSFLPLPGRDQRGVPRGHTGLFGN